MIQACRGTAKIALGVSVLTWAAAMILVLGYRFTVGHVVGVAAILVMVITFAGLATADCLQGKPRVWDGIALGVVFGAFTGAFAGLLMRVFLDPAHESPLHWRLGPLDSTAVGFVVPIAIGVAAGVTTGIVVVLHSRRSRR